MIKRIFWTLSLMVLAMSTGCQHYNLATNGCNECNSCTSSRAPSGRPARVGGPGEQAMTPGPMSAGYAYPWYTTRGPRDYFLDGPSTIGR